METEIKPRWTSLAIAIITVSTLLAAEPICRRLVFPAVHKHYSKATISKWTAYNAQHRIKPKAKEILAELDIICAEIKPDAIEQTQLLTAPSEALITPEFSSEFIAGPEDRISAIEGDSNYFLSDPIHLSVNPAPIPEPSPLILLGTGLLTLALITIQRNKQCPRKN